MFNLVKTCLSLWPKGLPVEIIRNNLFIDSSFLNYQSCGQNPFLSDLLFRTIKDDYVKKNIECLFIAETSAAKTELCENFWRKIILGQAGV